MHRLRPAVSIATLLAGEITAIVALHRLGRIDGFALPIHHLGAWLRHAPTEDLVAALARLAGLGAAWWLLVATVLSLARRVVPGWRHLRALDFLAPATVRRVVERAVAVGLGASLGLSGVHPVGAATRSPQPRVDIPVVRSASAPAPTPTTTPLPPLQPQPRRDTDASGPSRVVVVRAGDNLWVIAKHALEREHRATGPAAVTSYWRRVIEVNATGLRSHDPDLIFPGERIVLPALPDADPTAG